MGISKNKRIDRQGLKNKPARIKLPKQVLLGMPPTIVRPRRSAGPVVPAMQYMIAPTWGAHDAKSGGTSMEVTIGPLQGTTGYYGSVPQPNTPSVMRALLDNHPSYGWVAGHLLNDNLGGPGTVQNLTPLTTAGNKNHLNTCETLIKNTINACYARTLYFSSDTCWYGIYYKVVVGSAAHEKWGTTHPWDKVAINLTVWAHCVKMDKATGIILRGTAADTPSACWFDPIVGVLVDNAGYS